MIKAKTVHTMLDERIPPEAGIEEPHNLLIYHSEKRIRKKNRLRE